MKEDRISIKHIRVCIIRVDWDGLGKYEERKQKY